MKSCEFWILPFPPLLALSLAVVLSIPARSAEPPPAAPKPGPAPAVQILSERALPASLAKAADVRWASDRSIYLALRNEGVVEVPLEASSAPPRVVVPGRAQLGGFWYSTLLGASDRYLVAAAGAMTFTSVDLGTMSRRDEAFDAIHAVDVQEGRFLILGMRRDDQFKVGTDGAIAWLGSLDKKLADLRPVAYDATGPGIRNMLRCGGMRLGGVRFLSDGRFVVVPGVQPGVQLYDREGLAIRSWDTGSLGIDSDCGSLSEDESQALVSSIEGREAWISQRRTVDSVLPLPDGIGLVVRSRESGHLRWDLVVLKMDGGHSTYPLPIEAGGDLYHLKGDFRAGKMIFLLQEERAKDDKYPAPRLIVLSLPGLFPVHAGEVVSDTPDRPSSSKPDVEIRNERSLRILSETTLPPSLVKAADVRFASDTSLYLALRDQGVVEASLEPPQGPLKEWVAGRSQLGGFWLATHLGASSQYLVAASPILMITSVALSNMNRRDESFEAVHALDVRDNKLLILGLRRDEQQEVGKDGAIAWIGSLDRNLTDLTPVAYDATGPGIRDMGRCFAMRLGGARFLDDETFVIIPGVQPGIQLRDREGKLIRTWDTGLLGIDTDCASLTEEDGWRIQASYEENLAWINHRRTIDTVLPLPQGIGLLLRSIEKGRAHWDLKILRPDGGVTTHPVPIPADNDLLHLRGDVRAGKILLLLFEERANDEKFATPRLFTALPPEE